MTIRRIHILFAKKAPIMPPKKAEEEVAPEKRGSFNMFALENAINHTCLASSFLVFAAHSLLHTPTFKG